jgi:DNA helicase HerA-like ATPase
VGEALVSVLDAKGSPTIVQKTLIRPPLSLVGPISAAQREGVIQQSPVKGVYDVALNRESAYEILSGKVEQSSNAQSGSIWGTVSNVATAVAGGGEARTTTYSTRSTSNKSAGRQSDSLVTTMAKSVIRAAGSQIGRQVVRGLLGAMLKK